jgi:hypothetical protein
MLKLRLGVILIIISWLPFAQVLVYIAHNNNQLTSEDAASELRLAVWGIQILVGLIGLWLVGELAIKEVKEAGWRHTPRRLWKLFWSKEDEPV